MPKRVDIEECKSRAEYRVTCRLSGLIKSEMLKDIERGEQPSDIMRRALTCFYEIRRGGNNSY